MVEPFVISSLTIPGLVISVLVALGLLFTLAVAVRRPAADPHDPSGAARTAHAG